uniref:MICOS complex subunit MIC13 n=1 Tax=Cyanistes caeruleus TaxID=156563 RepID=A0A8C0VWS3_CYACU
MAFPPRTPRPASASRRSRCLSAPRLSPARPQARDRPCPSAVLASLCALGLACPREHELNCSACNSFRFLIKGGLAGAAVYVAYDQGLLGSGTEGAEAFKKAQETLPPAIQEWTNYLGWEVRTAQVIPAAGRMHTAMSALSVAPTRACEYTVEGWKYVKDLVK